MLCLRKTRIIWIRLCVLVRLEMLHAYDTHQTWMLLIYVRIWVDLTIITVLWPEHCCHTSLILSTSLAFKCSFLDEVKESLPTLSDKTRLTSLIATFSFIHFFHSPLPSDRGSRVRFAPSACIQETWYYNSHVSGLFRVGVPGSVVPIRENQIPSCPYIKTQPCLICPTEMQLTSGSRCSDPQSSDNQGIQQVTDNRWCHF